MSRYDRDPRVRRVNSNLYKVSDPDRISSVDWVVERRQWQAHCLDGEDPDQPVHRAPTADEAIYKIIWKPRRK